LKDVIEELEKENEKMKSISSTPAQDTIEELEKENKEMKCSTSSAPATKNNLENIIEQVEQVKEDIQRHEEE